MALLVYCSLPFTTQADVGDAEAPAGSTSKAAPYLRYRDMTLGYHGASEDQVDITEYRIGWFGPTDLDDPLNGDLWWAANHAVSAANASRGDSAFSAPAAPRPPFRLIARWSSNPWGTGVSELARMVFDEQPLALIGSIDSSTTHLAEQVVAKANLPLISPIATDKTATLAGVAWMFSCAPADNAVARTLVDAALGADGSTSDSGNQSSTTSPRNASVKGPRDGRSILLLSTTDHESRMTVREVMAELSRRGRIPDYRVDLAPGTADPRPQLAAVTAAKPAVVIVIAVADDAARVVRTVRDLLGDVDIVGGQSMGRRRFVELAGSAAEGVRFPLLFAPDDRGANASAFVNLFAAERGHAPDYAAALTYDATRLLLEAIERAGPNRARIREALHELSPWSGVSGVIRFDGTGQNARSDLRLGTIRDGVVTPVSPAAPAMFTTIPSPAP